MMEAVSPRTFITQENVEAMVRMYEDGFSSHEIASMMKLSSRTVMKYVRREGVAVRRYTTFRRIPDREYERTLFLYHDMNLTIKQTAHVLGLSEPAVNWRLKQAGRPASREAGRLKRRLNGS